MILAQLSDPHMRLGEGAAEARESLAAGVDAVLALRPHPDAVLVSGDLADTAAAEEYQIVRALLAPLPMPVHVLGGNHDDRDDDQFFHECRVRERICSSNECRVSVAALGLDRGDAGAAVERFLDPKQLESNLRAISGELPLEVNVRAVFGLLRDRYSGGIYLFSVLGLPVLPLLGFLRQHGEIPA